MTRAGVAKKSRFRLRFFSSTIAELKKVVWPTRQEAIRLTILVLAVCIALAVVLGALDYGFARLVRDVFLGGG